jgi:hypothetical protein
MLGISRSQSEYNIFFCHKDACWVFFSYYKDANLQVFEKISKDKVFDKIHDIENTNGLAFI